MPTVPMMMMPQWAAILIAVALPWAASAQSSDKRLSATAVGDAEITVDGTLDERIWAEAPVGTDFVERDPFPGRRPADAGARTEIRVLYDAEALYVGVTCFMPAGETPRAFELNRDSFNVFSDDAISIKIDVRLDQRTTLGFVTTPAGTQVDYVAVENGNGFRKEFDAIWQVATQVYDGRWTAEFRLPFAALGLPGHDGDRTLGFEVTRDHNAAQATYDWAPIPPQFGAVSALHYGRLEGLKEVAGGTPFTFIPYFLSRYDSPMDNKEVRAGGDFRLRIGEDTWSELTLLTDFSEVDLDDPIIYLDRFAILLSERRPFFLSGLEVFQTGAGGLSQIFSSRSIGLDSRARRVPLLGGLKVYGSEGNLRYGLLQVVTDDSTSVPAQNHTVVSTRYNFGEVGNIGLMGTLNGNLRGLTDRSFGDRRFFEPNYSFALDAGLRLFDRKIQISGFAAATHNADKNEDKFGMDADQQGYSGQVRAKYNGLNFSPSASFALISKAFDPLIGFVARNDLLQSRVDLFSIYRTPAFGLRNLSLYASAQAEYSAHDLNYLGRSAAIDASAQWESGVRAHVRLSPTEDVVVRDFFLSAADRTVQAGTYKGVKIDTGISSPGRRNPVASLDYAYSSAFFGGQLHQVRASARWSMAALMRFEVGTTVNFLDFPGQKLRTPVTVNGKIVLTPDTKISVDLIGQANTNNKKAAALMRLRWRYLPGSDLFFVYTEFLDFNSEGEDERSLALKLSYRFDLVY